MYVLLHFQSIPAQASLTLSASRILLHYGVNSRLRKRHLKTRFRSTRAPLFPTKLLSPNWEDFQSLVEVGWRPGWIYVDISMLGFRSGSYRT